MTVSQSTTSTGKGDSGARSAGPRPGGAAGMRQRKTTGTAKTTVRNNAGNAGMWRFYNEDSPGLKVGPVPVLVMSLIFIASVFILHILGKYTRN